MKAVILAAGIGSRLRPLTDAVPKCMVEVNEIKIIQNQLNSLLENDIKEVLVVAGYKSDVLIKYLEKKFPNVKVIENKDYLKTNNMYSMFLAKEFLEKEEFVFMNADVFFDKKIIKELMNDLRKDLIVCDNGFYLEESMKIIKEGNSIKKISKQISEDEAYGSTIDVYKFSKEASNKFFAIIENYIKYEKEMNLWTEVAIDKLLSEHNFDSFDMKYNWVEIDNQDDLKQANTIFNN